MGSKEVLCGDTEVEFAEQTQEETETLRAKLILFHHESADLLTEEEKEEENEWATEQRSLIARAPRSWRSDLRQSFVAESIRRLLAKAGVHKRRQRQQSGKPEESTHG